MKVLVIGAGIIGAACAYYCAKAGHSVTVLDAGPIAGGTSGSGEGNILVSDKEAGPELDLALVSVRLWRELDIGEIELENKGGIIAAATAEGLSAAATMAEAQRASGVISEPVDDLRELEPHIAGDLAGGFYYPQDLQTQPMLAAARLLAASCADVRPHTQVTGIRTGEVITEDGRIGTDAIVNAAGTWGGDVAALAGAPLSILPRRGFVLVTEPLPVMVRHKVYAAEYVANIASDDPGLESSAVVEGTHAGPILIGSSRERVGFDREFSLPVLRRIAAQATTLFPFLADVHIIRTYRGFRPYCPDHLPVIGPDPRVPGLYHACGHEGAGVGLAPGTGALIAHLITGTTPELDPSPFLPDRFLRTA